MPSLALQESQLSHLNSISKTSIMYSRGNKSCLTQSPGACRSFSLRNGKYLQIHLYQPM
jgi:hypothetical protein